MSQDIDKIIASNAHHLLKDTDKIKNSISRIGIWMVIFAFLVSLPIDNTVPALLMYGLALKLIWYGSDGNVSYTAINILRTSSSFMAAVFMAVYIILAAISLF